MQIKQNVMVGSELRRSKLARVRYRCFSLRSLPGSLIALQHHAAASLSFVTSWKPGLSPERPDLSTIGGEPTSHLLCVCLTSAVVLALLFHCNDFPPQSLEFSEAIWMVTYFCFSETSQGHREPHHSSRASLRLTSGQLKVTLQLTGPQNGLEFHTPKHKWIAQSNSDIFAAQKVTTSIGV